MSEDVENSEKSLNSAASFLFSFLSVNDFFSFAEKKEKTQSSFYQSTNV